MDKEKLKKTVVFRGMEDDELDVALAALGAAERKYAKDEVILHAGSTTDMMGLVLEGSVRIESNEKIDSLNLSIAAAIGMYAFSGKASLR